MQQKFESSTETDDLSAGSTKEDSLLSDQIKSVSINKAARQRRRTSSTGSDTGTDSGQFKTVKPKLESHSLKSSPRHPVEVHVIVKRSPRRTKQSETGEPVQRLVHTTTDSESGSPVTTAYQPIEIHHDFSNSGEPPSTRVPFNRNSRGRHSERISRKMVDKSVKASKRSSSVESALHKVSSGCCNADTVVTADKPPIGKTTSKENIAPKMKSASKGDVESRSNQEKTKSEQSSDDEDDELTYALMQGCENPPDPRERRRQSSGSSDREASPGRKARKKKTLSKHKRY